ncbi:hypothetical protein XENTR_v10001613 [Xenopus tropicalis]|nr:hypothetical protein XENTR_v10001613 [Xenopus tropicalis]
MLTLMEYGYFSENRPSILAYAGTRQVLAGTHFLWIVIGLVKGSRLVISDVLSMNLKFINNAAVLCGSKSDSYLVINHTRGWVTCLKGFWLCISYFY